MSLQARAVPPPPPRPMADPSRRRGGWGRRLLLFLLFAVVVVVGLGVLGQLFLGGAPAVGDESWLEIRFTESYPESAPDRTGMEGALRPTQISAQDLLEALRRVRGDDRIRGVLLRPDGFPGSWAQAQELGDALSELRGAGKRVVAHLTFPSSLDYALAASADEILVAPEGLLATVGLRARLTFLAGSLQKVGAEADFVAIGRYKSAPEQLQRARPSPPSRVQVEAYLDDVMGWWTDWVASRRQLDAASVADLVDTSPIEAARAVESGWADEMVDLHDWLDGRDLRSDENLVSIFRYLSDSEELGSDEARVATVYVDGTIQGGSSGSDPVFGPIAGSETVIERLERAAADTGVGAVVLRVDSPGGSAPASDAIHRAVQRVRRAKPVVASLGGSAASGGYYVAMGADAIVADPLTITGSIGVFTGKIVLAGLYEKLGVTHTTLDRGTNAGMFDDLAPFTAVQRAAVEDRLRSFYRRFVQRVAEGRDLSPAAVDSVAGGRVWSGRRARDHELVDELGSYARALSVAAERAGLEGPVRVRTYQPRPGLLERVLQRTLLVRGSSALSPRTGWAPLARRVGASLRAWDGSVQYLLPWQIDVR